MALILGVIISQQIDKIKRKQHYFLNFIKIIVFMVAFCSFLKAKNAHIGVARHYKMLYKVDIKLE